MVVVWVRVCLPVLGHGGEVVVDGDEAHGVGLVELVDHLDLGALVALVVVAVEHD